MLVLIAAMIVFLEVSSEHQNRLTVKVKAEGSGWIVFEWAGLTITVPPSVKDPRAVIVAFIASCTTIKVHRMTVSDVK